MLNVLRAESAQLQAFSDKQILNADKIYLQFVGTFAGRGKEWK